MKNLKKGADYQNISPASKQKIRKRLETWVKAIQAYNSQPSMKKKRKIHFPVFLTLTLSSEQIHPDEIIKRDILMPFLQQLKRDGKTFYYFWKAEKQRNGRIHFHLLLDKFIDKFEIQLLWNKYQNRLNYAYRYYEQSGKTNPPSTQIEAPKNWYTFYNYLVKYIVKDETDIPVTGRKWMMSRKLQELKTYSDIASAGMTKTISELEAEGKVIIHWEDYYTVVIFTDKFDLQRDMPTLYIAQKKFLLQVYSDLYSVPPE